jgi:hypothetical protein
MTARTARDERREEFTSTRTTLELWFGMLGGPASGFAMVLINYPVVDRACVTDSPLWLHVVALLFLSTALLACFTSWRLHQRLGDWPETGRGLMPRAHFMTTVGLLTSFISVLEILFQWIPIFFIGACHGT